MLPATGIYGHTRNQILKSLALFGGFLISLTMMWAILCFALVVLQQIFGSRSMGPADVIGGFGRLVLQTLHVPLVAGLVWGGAALTFRNRLITAITGARPVSRRDAPQLYRLIETLSIAAGIPVPRVEVVRSSALNAFASGLSRSDASVAVTQGLLDRLSPRELQAVLAHEIAHIRNNDIWLMMLATLLQGFLAHVAELVWTRLTRHAIPLADIFMTRPQHNGGPDVATRQYSRLMAFLFWSLLILVPFVADGVLGREAGKLWAAIGLACLAGLGVIVAVKLALGLPTAATDRLGYLPGLGWLLIAPIWLVMMLVGFVMALGYVLSCWTLGSICRSREMVADAGAVELTKDADALVMALVKIDGRDRIDTLEPAMQAMMICGPHSGWLATHPPLEERIEALRQYSGARLRLQPAAA